MKSTPLIIALALVTHGCGSWSNRDLEFAAALPSRGELRSKLPQQGSTSQGLSLSGLNVGDPSKAYRDTTSAQQTFNGLLDFFLGVLDTVRVTPPTTRTQSSRVWGPYPDQTNVGFEFEVEVRQASERRYEWSMRARRLSTQEVLPIVDGIFEPTATAREGAGQFTVHLAGFKNVLEVDEGFKVIDQIQVQYQTNVYPRVVLMGFTFETANPDGISAVGYAYGERADGSGALAYEIASTSADIAVLHVQAGWVASGPGRALSTVKAGRLAGFTVGECWDQAFKVVLYAESWPGGTVSGRVEDCVELPE